MSKKLRALTCVQNLIGVDLSENNDSTLITIGIKNEYAEEAINALKKQIPKSATFVRGQEGFLTYKCNACNKEFFAKTNTTKYCINCGQRLAE
jgi:ribosomal protein S27E